MTTAGAQAGLATFEQLEINYEHAYGDNPLKKACVNKAISLLPKRRSVLDVGCGTGKPVSDMLSHAGFEVTGVDISPKMVGLAKSRVRGTFVVADLLDYQPEKQFAGVFIIFSLLQLSSYDDFHKLMEKYSGVVEPGGILVLGTMPADNYVTDKAAYDKTGTYAVDYPTPFMGMMEPTFFMTAGGLVDFVTSMGFETVSNDIGVFHPSDPRCVPEDQQYIIAQRPIDTVLIAPSLKSN